MICPINNGYTVPCKSIGGLKEIRIANFSEDVVYTYTNGLITYIENIQDYYTIELDKETASFTQVGSFSNENGTAFYTKTISFVLHGLTQALINFITILGKGNWSVIFVDQNNQYWLLEPKNRINVIASTPGLGKAYGDLNGAVITMETKGPNPASQIDENAFGFICPILNVSTYGSPDDDSVQITWHQDSSLTYDIYLYDTTNDIVVDNSSNISSPYIVTGLISGDDFTIRVYLTGTDLCNSVPYHQP
jgi:hypothetical protein